MFVRCDSKDVFTTDVFLRNAKKKHQMLLIVVICICILQIDYVFTLRSINSLYPPLIFRVIPADTFISSKLLYSVNTLNFLTILASIVLADIIAYFPPKKFIIK